MPKLYIMCGLAFSGKSTLARKIAESTGSKIVAFDKLWVKKDKENPIPKNAEGWKFIRKIAQEQVISYLKEGVSVVYDDNNAKREHRDELRNVANEVGAESIVIFLDTSLEVLQERENANKISHDRHEVEPENFQKVLDDLEIPTSEENVFVFNPKSKMEGFLAGLE